VNCYPFIEAEELSDHSVKRACELLEVSRSAYYTDRVGRPSLHQQHSRSVMSQSLLSCQSLPWPSVENMFELTGVVSRLGWLRGSRKTIRGAGNCWGWARDAGIVQHRRGGEPGGRR